MSNRTSDKSWLASTRNSGYLAWAKHFAAAGKSYHAPDVVFQYNESQFSGISAHKFLREFLSAWVWVEQQRAREFISGKNATAARVGPGPLLQNIADPFNLPYLPDWHDEKAGLALALYREAINSAGAPHGFLSFWKILSIKNPDQAKGPQRDWLLATFTNLAASDGATRLDELRSRGKSDEDIALHLYVSGRCAVAHAHLNPIVNPDNPEHEEELAKDMPLIKALAEHLIESEYGIESEQSFLLRNPSASSRCSHTKVRMFWLPQMDASLNIG